MSYKLSLFAFPASVSDDAILGERRKRWKPIEPRYTSGFLAKYARLAHGAERGAITNL